MPLVAYILFKQTDCNPRRHWYKSHFKIPVIGLKPESKQLLLLHVVAYSTSPKSLITIGQQLFELSCSQTDRQTDRDRDRQTDRQTDETHKRKKNINFLADVKMYT